MHVSLIVAVGCVVGTALALPPIPAYVVVRQGDTLGVSTVSTLNSPFTDGNGRVGFVGSLADSQRFIWWNTGPVFFSNDALPDVLTGGESTMGVSDTGGFIYSPSVNGNDAVHTHAGTLLQKGDPIPPLPGLFSSFNSRPTMLPDGTAYWVGGSTPTQGSSTSTNRHLFKATDPSNPASITRVLGGGDLINGIPIKTTASNFDYWISDNGLHHIHVLDMDTGSTTNNEHVYLDGAFVAQEGHSAGGGELWESFDIVGVNNAGNYIFTGDTNCAVAGDRRSFLAYQRRRLIIRSDGGGAGHNTPERPSRSCRAMLCEPRASTISAASCTCGASAPTSICSTAWAMILPIRFSCCRRMTRSTRTAMGFPTTLSPTSRRARLSGRGCAWPRMGSYMLGRLVRSQHGRKRGILRWRCPSPAR